MKGQITAIVREKGYGFIQDEFGSERFFHARNVRGVDFATLEEGTSVQFKPVQQATGGKGNGLRAEHVELA